MLNYKISLSLVLEAIYNIISFDVYLQFDRMKQNRIINETFLIRISGNITISLHYKS